MDQRSFKGCSGLNLKEAKDSLKAIATEDSLLSQYERSAIFSAIEAIELMDKLYIADDMNDYGKDVEELFER